RGHRRHRRSGRRHPLRARQGEVERPALRRGVPRLHEGARSSRLSLPTTRWRRIMAAARWPVAPGCRTRGSIALTTLILSGAILRAVVGAGAAGRTSVANAHMALGPSGADPGPVDGLMVPATKTAIHPKPL